MKSDSVDVLNWICSTEYADKFVSSLHLFLEPFLASYNYTGLSGFVREDRVGGSLVSSYLYSTYGDLGIDNQEQQVCLVYAKYV